MEWEERAEVKKGNSGEKIVNEYLINKGYIPYSPDVSTAHPFDRIVASKDKKGIFIADAKTKAKRKFYPDTGIEIKHWKEYSFISKKYSIKVFIFFFDEENQSIYGNWLSKLEEPQKITVRNNVIEYPLFQGSVIYFPMVNMVDIAKISERQAVKISELTTKNIIYK